nr:hypothetical protein GCM10020241_40940 [Streptoalloteichus tenebrarius]
MAAGGVLAALDGTVQNLPPVPPSPAQAPRDGEPMTEQLPRIPGAPAGPSAAEDAVEDDLDEGPSTARWYPDLEDDDEDAGSDGGNGAVAAARPAAGERPEGDEDDDAPLGDEPPAGLADADEIDEAEEEARERSPGKEWLVMVSQLGVGLLGGGALWLGFQWLWQTFAAVALIAALVVTVGLVLVVRVIRKADDVQTTVLAVLVGLVVTVSPAALLLVHR